MKGRKFSKHQKRLFEAPILKNIIFFTTAKETKSCTQSTLQFEVFACHKRSGKSYEKNISTKHICYSTMKVVGRDKKKGGKKFSFFHKSKIKIRHILKYSYLTHYTDIGDFF